MKKVLVLLSSFLLFGFSAAFASNINIGVVDFGHILQKSPQVAAINKKIQADFAPQKQKIMEAQKKISAEAKQLAPDNAKKLSAAQHKKIQDKLAKQQKDLQEMMFKFQEKINAAQNKATQQFIKKVDKTVKMIAKKDKLDLVLVKQVVVYPANAVDVTKDVIAQLSEK